MIIVAFLIGIATDWIWTKYFQAVQAKRAIIAANWSVAIFVCGLTATYLMIEKEYFAMIGFALGGWLGTYGAIKYERRQNMLGK